MNAQRFLRPICAVSSALILLVTTACSSETPTPAPSNLPYTDDFANSQSGWQTSTDPSGEVKYDNGRMRVTVNQQQLVLWSVSSKQFTDGVFEVDAQAVGGPQDNGFGVLFRFKDRKNFYQFSIASDGSWRTSMTKDGKETVWSDWQPHPSIQPDSATNHIKVVMTGNKFVFYVNDQQLGQQTDDSFASGDIGVFAMTFIDKPGTDVAFDNVRISEVPAAPASN